MNQLSTEQATRLARLEAIPGEKVMTIGIKQYLSIATTCAVLGKSRSAVSKWCMNKTVFRNVKRSPEEHNGCYLIPLEEVERVILEDALPQVGNPRFVAGAPYPYQRKKKATSSDENKIADPA
jgi:hypothetical protein